MPMGDPYSDGLNDLGDIPPHYLKEIEHFFQVYKDLEGTRTVTRGFEGAAAAREAIVQAMGMYTKRVRRAVAIAELAGWLPRSLAPRPPSAATPAVPGSPARPPRPATASTV